MTFSQTDWGRTPETLGTYFRNSGDELPKQWGRTSATMGTNLSYAPKKLDDCPIGKSHIPPKSVSLTYRRAFLLQLLHFTTILSPFECPANSEAYAH